MTAREECTCIFGHGGGGRLPMDDCPVHSKGGGQNGGVSSTPDVAEPRGEWNEARKGAHILMGDRVRFAPGPSDVLERLKEFEVYHYLRGPKQERLIYDAIAEIERLMETNRLISLDIHKAWEALEQIAYNDTARRPGDCEDLIETAAKALEGK